MCGEPKCLAIRRPKLWTGTQTARRFLELLFRDVNPAGAWIVRRDRSSSFSIHACRRRLISPFVARASLANEDWYHQATLKSQPHPDPP